MTDTLPKDNDWIDWNGGECPVDPDTTVDVEFANGEAYSGSIAEAWDWSRKIPREDLIVAYRVVRP